MAWRPPHFVCPVRRCCRTSTGCGTGLFVVPMDAAKNQVRAPAIARSLEAEVCPLQPDNDDLSGPRWRVALACP
jgi:hypothetical protein